MSARLDVSLDALATNYQQLARLSPIGCVVKADAYGLGAVRLGQHLHELGCRDFFVANESEALQLRTALSDRAASRIYVFNGQTDPQSCDGRIQILPVLNSVQQIALWPKDQPAALHIDSGMNRLGLNWDEIAKAADARRYALVLTHFASADEDQSDMNTQQLARAAELRELFPNTPISYGNSAALLRSGEDAGWISDLARPGIALYGGNPFVDRPNPMRPVASLWAQILQFRHIGAGEAVGYGATYRATQDMRLATVDMGYADGVSRLLSNRGAMSMDGQRCAIVGRVSMDLTCIDVSHVASAAMGDRVELFGAAIGIDEVAAWAQTISYEVLTGIGPRPVRRYL